MSSRTSQRDLQDQFWWHPKLRPMAWPFQEKLGDRIMLLALHKDLVDARCPRLARATGVSENRLAEIMRDARVPTHDEKRKLLAWVRTMIPDVTEGELFRDGWDEAGAQRVVHQLLYADPAPAVDVARTA